MTYASHGHSRSTVRVIRNGPPALVVGLIFLTVGFTILVSAYMLDAHGIPYGIAGGNALFKIHPMTYCGMVALISAMIASGDPVDYVRRHIERFPGTSYFLVILVLMVAWTAVIQKQPLTALIDTFFSAILLIYLISDLTPRQHRFLTTCVHVVICANACLGIVEVASGWRLTPLLVAGTELVWDWRASAFFGHPLENAMVTGLYALMLGFGADARLPVFLRIAMIGLMCVSQAAFGGRAAMVLSFAILGARAFVMFLGVLRGNRFDPRLAALILMAIPLIGGVFLVAFNSGLFDRLIERFVDDQGSAATRVALLRIFYGFPLTDLLIAPPPDMLAEQIYLEGTDAGIESFEFGFFLQSGLLISLSFFCGLAAMTFDIWRIGGRAALVHILYFYAVASGAASLSVKGQTLAQFVVLFMTVEAVPSLFERPQTAARPPRDRS